MEKNKALLIIVVIWIIIIAIVILLMVLSPNERITCVNLAGQKICSHCPISDVNATAFKC